MGLRRVVAGRPAALAAAHPGPARLKFEKEGEGKERSKLEVQEEKLESGATASITSAGIGRRLRKKVAGSSRLRTSGSCSFKLRVSDVDGSALSEMNVVVV